MSESQRAILGGVLLLVSMLITALLMYSDGYTTRTNNGQGGGPTGTYLNCPGKNTATTAG